MFLWSVVALRGIDVSSQLPRIISNSVIAMKLLTSLIGVEQNLSDNRKYSSRHVISIPGDEKRKKKIVEASI